MRSRVFQWIVLFFSRPITLADLSALASRLKPAPKSRAQAEARAEPEPSASQRSLPSRVDAAGIGGRGGDARTGPSGKSSMFRPELEIAVSEQPLDSLPAELQDELVRPKSGRLEGSSSPPGPA